MATIISDTFTAANGTAIQGRTPAPTNVPGNTWTDLSTNGNFTIQSNQALGDAGPPAGAFVGAVIDTGQTDVACSVDVTTTNQDAYYGLMGRYQDAQNKWVVGVIDTENLFGILEVFGNVYTLRASIAFTTANNTTYAISATFSANTITATVNGGHQISCVSSDLQTQTKFGLYGSSATVWDNFLISSAPLVAGAAAAVVTGASAVALAAGGFTGGFSNTFKFQRAPNVPCADPYGSPGTWADLNSYGAGLTFTDSTATQGTQYWYRCAGKDGAGNVVYTRPVWAVTAGVPAFPTFSTGGIAALYRWEMDTLTGLYDGQSIASLTEQNGTGKALTSSTGPIYQSKGWPFADPVAVFNGASSQYLKASTAADWTFLHDGTPWDISFTLRFNNNTTSSTLARGFILATGGKGGTDKGLKIYFDNKAGDGLVQALQVAIFDGSGGVPLNVVTQNILAPLRTHSLRVTFDGTTATIYNWGVQVGTGTKTGALPTGVPAGPLTIGIDPVTNDTDPLDADITHMDVVKGAILNAADAANRTAYLEVKYHPGGNVPKEWFLDSSSPDKWTGTYAISGLTVDAPAPVRYGGNPLLGGTRDPDNFYLWFTKKTFGPGDHRLWAGVVDHTDGAAHQNSAYATSTDMRAWSTPTLNQVTYGGSNANNLFAPSDGEGWYIAGVHHSAVGFVSGGTTYYYLANLDQKQNLATGIFLGACTNLDGIAAGTWSDFATVSGSFTFGEGVNVQPRPDGRWFITGTYGQPGARSYNLWETSGTDPATGWSNLGIVLTGTLADQYHGMAPLVRMDAWICLCTCGQLDQQSNANDTINLGLFATRDFGRYVSKAKKLWFVPAGGQWDGNQILQISDPVINGTNWDMLYTASAGKNAVDAVDTIPFKLGLMSVPIERLMRLYGTGTITTRAIYRPGQSLNVNADGSGGTITFALLDSAGNVISGYDDTRSTVINNDVAYPGRTVKWGSANATLPSQACRIRATLTGVTGGLYSWATGAPISFTGIEFDAASNSGDQAAVSSVSFSVPWNGSNRMLAIDVPFMGAAGSVSAMTYGGATCTLIGAQNVVGGTGRIECWRIKGSDSGAPGVGSNTLVVTYSGVIADTSVNCVSYTGVDQTSPTEAFAGNSGINAGTATDATVVVTPTANLTWCHFALATSKTSGMASSNTGRNLVAGAGGTGGDSDTGVQITPAAAQTGRWTGNGITSAWAAAGYAVRPVPTSNNYTQSLSGSLAGSGSTTKATARSQTGSLAITGTPAVRGVSRQIAASLTAAGVLAKASMRAIGLVGTVTLLAVLSRSVSMSKTGAITVLGVLGKASARLRTLTGSLVSSGSLVRALVKFQTLTGSVVLGGATVVKLASRRLVGLLAFVGSLVRSGGKAVAAGGSWSSSRRQSARWSE